MACRICNVSSQRYKCPKCLIPYCSLACWKIHKNENCTKAVNEDLKEDNLKNNSYNFVTESTVSLNKLQNLQGNQELKDILQNPHVRNILLAIDSSKNPTEAMENAMQEPIFVEFVEECLKVVEPTKDL